MLTVETRTVRNVCVPGGNSDSAMGQQSVRAVRP